MELDQLIETGKNICTAVGAITISAGFIYFGGRGIYSVIIQRIGDYIELKHLEKEGYQLEEKPTIFNAKRLANKTFRL